MTPGRRFELRLGEAKALAEILPMVFRALTGIEPADRAVLAELQARLEAWLGSV